MISNNETLLRDDKVFFSRERNEIFPSPRFLVEIYLTEIFDSSVPLSYTNEEGYEREKLISEVGVPTTVKTFSKDYFSPILSGGKI